MKNFFKILLVIIGTLVGAGFASGKELYIFFVAYDFYGLLGLLFSNILIGLVIYRTLSIMEKNNFYNYSDFLNFLFKNKKFKFYFNFIIKSFLLISFIIMISGFNSFLYQEFNIPTFLSCILISCLSYLIFTKNISGILNINLFLIPFLIIIIFLFGFIDFTQIQLEFNFLNSNSSIIPCFLSSILYTSYNSIILIPLLISLNKSFSFKKFAKSISFSSTLILTILSLIVFVYIYLIKRRS